MTHQELRNTLCSLEDTARSLRNDAMHEGKDAAAFALICRLTQIIREEIIK